MEEKNINPPDDGDKPTLVIPEIGPIPDEMPAREQPYVGGIGQRELPLMADLLADGPQIEIRDSAIMTFIKAQGAFIRAQSYFLEQGRTELDDKIYIQHLTGFATAQATLIRAQQDFMQLFGAM